MWSASADQSIVWTLPHHHELHWGHSKPLSIGEKYSGAETLRSSDTRRATKRGSSGRDICLEV
ncbi:uncharacterized protein N7529_004208 [Penicillium soppii]|uniref:uncharacterized protein n=1 Tax=Penicillium soppii TaxID=69789 RepID=UPI00254851C1|nr:uncharacterized protein N7529_004208 [Penicillium soppii]KAJ5871855.1 hypothetical protein N7529_004208 [Penicillium soppii]